ncbi:MAG: thioredoxin family protein [Spirochaetia bacterium]|nr:thioredoxin family protein [Spirochaetia bacterium]
MRLKFRAVLLLLLALFVSGCEADSSKNTPSNKDAVATAAKVSFIELGSVNCVPCKMMQPIMDEIREEYPQQVEVIFYDVWTPEERPYAAEYGIRVIPTQVFLDSQGNEYFRHEGFLPKEQLLEILKQKGVGR